MAAAVPFPPKLAPPDPNDPVRIGEFRLIGRLGSDDLGIVHAALDADGRCAALKATTAPAVALDRGTATAYTVPVLVSGTHKERPWAAIAYVPGTALAEHVAAHGPLEGAALLALAAATAEVLAAVHTSGSAHGTLNPEQVILTAEGPRVIDWRLAPAQSAPALTDDIADWGRLIAHAATGSPQGQVPQELHDLITRARAQDPADRPSAEELRGEALALLGEEPLEEVIDEHWPPVDTSWHDPAAWAAAAGEAPEEVPPLLPGMVPAAQAAPTPPTTRPRPSTTGLAAILAALMLLAFAVIGGAVALNSPYRDMGRQFGAHTALTGMELAEAALAIMSRARSYEIDRMSMEGEGSGPRQGLPTDIARALGRSTLHYTYACEPSEVLLMERTSEGLPPTEMWWDGALLSTHESDQAITWYEVPQPASGWEAYSTPDWAPTLFRSIIDTGRIAEERETVFSADLVTHNPKEFDERDSAPSGRPGLWLRGTLVHEGGAGQFVLITTGKGVPMSLSLEYLREYGWVYHEYTFRSLNQPVEIETPAPDQIRPWEEHPGP